MTVNGLTPMKSPLKALDRFLSPTERRTPLRALVKSPLSIHLLSPNDDQSEKEKARNARALAQRRRPIAVQKENVESNATSDQNDSNILSREVLTELMNKCLKLAAENKINQGNTWDLNLIDHLSDLVKNDNSHHVQTNFQQASCTLEAGVKIYSHRVDSVHIKAYKVLGALGRNARDESVPEADHEDDDGGALNTKRPGPQEKKTANTLESSYDALNVKKLDVVFTVDPLFKKTSAQFDEGGAKGLLLNNLSVYCGCEIAFDSLDVPELRMSAFTVTESEKRSTLDLSSMKESIDKMLYIMQTETEITPTLKEILRQIDDPYRAAAEAEMSHGEPRGLANDLKTSTAESWLNAEQNDGEEENDPGEVFDNGNDIENEDMFRCFENGSPESATWDNLEGDHEDGEEDAEVRDEDVTLSRDPAEWLGMGIGMPAKSNAWAGPAHWKYTKPKDDPSNEKKSQAEIPSKEKKRGKKGDPFSIDFENLPDVDLTAFAPPQNPRLIVLPQSTVASSTLLPEDCHYHPSNLTRFFLRPSVQCIRRPWRKRIEQGESVKDFNSMGDESLWDADDDATHDAWDANSTHSEVEDPLVDDLIPQPRKVQRIGVTYDRYSKQVDINVLKETLWEKLHDRPEETRDQEAAVSFQRLLREMPSDCPAAAPEDISVHLCFICLLHLANEHCLYIEDCSTMDDLQIHLDGILNVS